MEAIERRLNELVEQYGPARLILAGDIVHSTVTKRQAESLITRLSRLGPELTLIRGNHDLGLSGLPLLDQVSIDEFRFHHGHLDLAPEPSIRDVVGHVHPSWVFNDAAGSRFRRPAMIQTANRFILPAFSPWAAGARFEIGEPHRIWVCGKNRILRLEVPEPYPVRHSPQRRRGRQGRRRIVRLAPLTLPLPLTLTADCWLLATTANSLKTQEPLQALGPGGSGCF
jgi:hypothetical protein